MEDIVYWCWKFPPTQVCVTSFGAVKKKLRIWHRTFHNSGAANMFLFTIQTFNEHSRMAELFTRPHAMKCPKSIGRMLTRAPLGYFYNAPHWGGGLFRAPPPSDLRNCWTDSQNSSGIWKPWKNWRENKFCWPRGREWRHRSRQSRNVRLFGLGDIGEQNCIVKFNQCQRIGMDIVSDICKYHLLCFVTIIEVKVISGHQVRSSNFFSWFRAAIHVFRSDFR